MDEFQRSLERDKNTNWSSKYLDYTVLQRQVDRAAETNGERDQDDQKKAFQDRLDQEVKKILTFYKEENEEVQKEVQKLQGGSSYRQTYSQELTHACQHVTDLLQYISVNMRGLRKILNRYARCLDPEPPEDGCVALEVERPHHSGNDTFQGTSLPKVVADDLDNMLQHAPLTDAADTVRQHYRSLCQSDKRLPSGLLTKLKDTMQRMERAEGKADRNSDLVHTLSHVERWAGIYEEAPSDDAALGGYFGLAVNCLSAALYMANYQLVLPDMEDYLMHIGAQSSWGGIVVGCCDVATLPGALGYSLWTNKSFKLPLLAGAVACILGNCLYSMGYDSKALWLLLASRLVVGLGSARTVNRRYIADFVSKGNRTKASAAFVTSSAVGMACGPLLALPLSYLPQTSFGPISINKVTAGGYVMGLLWAAYFLVTCFFLEEPKNSDKDSDHDKNADRSESQALLSDQEDDADMEKGQDSKPEESTSSDDNEDQKTWKSQLQPTLLMFFTLFLVKLVQQGFLSSLSTFTSKLYGWTSSQSGLTLAAYGFSLIPLNFAVGKASAHTSDRLFSAVLLGTITVGAAICICAGKPVWLFLFGGALVFTAAMTLEGSAMSLLSKVMAPSLAEGTFNTGLLTTEAGGFGRLAGNLAIAAFSKLTGTDEPSQVYSFGHYLFGLLALVTAGNGLYFGSMWSKVEN